jgi:hypothetical protein
MSLSNNQRHILVSKIQTRNDERVPDHAERYTLQEIQKIIWSKYIANNTQVLFQNDTKKIRIKELRWFSSLENKQNYFCLLLGLGDKNTPDAVYESFITEETREFQKEDHEGGSFATHILIRQDTSPDPLYHLALIERVNGLSIGVIKRYLSRLLNDRDHMKEYINERKRPIPYRPIFEIFGYQSQTLRQALTQGTLEDIQFVSHEIKDGDGFDEYKYINEKVKQVNLKISKRIEESNASAFFASVLSLFNDEKHQEMYVKIKSDDGKVNCQKINTDIDLEKQDVIDQFFIESKCISDFSPPLIQSHRRIREDMLSKMLHIMNGTT